MDKFALDEYVNLTANTRDIDDGEELNVRVSLLDKDKNLLAKKEDSVAVKKNEALYRFQVKDVADELNISRGKVKYAKLWMDKDGDAKLSYDEEDIIEVTREENLRIGLFFDGTGNSSADSEILSNIRKLFLVYPNNFDPEFNECIITDEKKYPGVQSAYIRGVGSKDADGEEDSVLGVPLGGGFGQGATQRLEGMLFYIEKMIAIFEKEYKYLPTNLHLDIFGFSRGAAMARHFVNVLKQDDGSFYTIEYKFEAKNLKITTLNLFDTVGSIGMAGKDIDPGFTYHIDENYIEKAITHFIADDEYRYNFDGQLIATNDIDYPTDIVNDKIVEEVFIGAHSDIGGGYKVVEDQLTNHHLQNVTLNKMYERCQSVEVPLLKKPEGSEWDILKKLGKELKYFEDMYNKYQGLKVAHKKLREWQAYYSDKFVSGREKLNKERQEKIASLSRFGKPRDEDIYTRYELDVVAILNNDWSLFQEFLQKSNEFHDEYVHISYNKVSTLEKGEDLGMFSETKEDRRHRDYFIPKYEDMRALSDETSKEIELSSRYAYSGGGAAPLGVMIARANKDFTPLKAKEFKDI